MWKTLKLLLNEKRNDNDNGIIFNNVLITENKLIAEKFNRFFLESVEQITVNLNPNNHYDAILNNMEKTNCKLERFKLMEIKNLKKS